MNAFGSWSNSAASSNVDILGDEPSSLAPVACAPVYVLTMRKRWIGLGVVLVVWWIQRGQAPHTQLHVAHAAVTADGFAVMASKVIREYDRAGNVQHEMPVRLAQGNVRFVGTRGGPAIGWQDGKKFKLAVLDGDGNPQEPSTWGKNVKQLCDGQATNEYRFGIGFLETDGKVWFVHGPVDRLTVEANALALPPVTKASWCGLASAEQNVVLLFREGARLLMNFCSRKQCESLVVKVPIDTKDALLGYGCVQDSCLFATRDKHGTTKLHRVTNKGRAITKQLEHARPDSPVSIVGAGTRAFAIAYIANDNNAAIQRVAVDGTFTNVWHWNGEVVPSLAWAAGKLFVAMPTRDAWVLDLPR
jgi:hypothetical protein